jgi:hypothetical protein
MSPRYPSRVRASTQLAPCDVQVPDTSDWRFWEVPWPSPHVGPLWLRLPPEYWDRLGSMREEGDTEEEFQERLSSTNRALGIWFAPALGPLVDPSRIRSWALHISPEEEYGSAGIGPTPTILEERECRVVGRDGRKWNVVTFVAEQSENGVTFWLTAYSSLGRGLYLRAGGHGAAPDFEAEAFGVLSSIEGRS